MTPSEFINEFPKSTKSIYIDKVVYKNKLSTGSCSLLVDDRKYVAPIGFTVQGDVSNGAKGVDEWVATDGGDSYTINNFEWTSVGDQGTTQLVVHFNTLSCK